MDLRCKAHNLRQMRRNHLAFALYARCDSVANVVPILFPVLMLFRLPPLIPRSCASRVALRFCLFP
jgi:hypothetical protein